MILAVTRLIIKDKVQIVYHLYFLLQICFVALWKLDESSDSEITNIIYSQYYCEHRPTGEALQQLKLILQEV